MKSLMTRVGALALMTLRELLRQNIVYGMLIPSMLLLGFLPFFAQLNFDQQLKFMRDFSYGTMSLFGVFLAIIATAQSVSHDRDHKTILTILAKPMHRWEYLLGKMLGIAGLLLGVLLFLTLFSIVVFRFQENQLVSIAISVSPTELTSDQIQLVRSQILNPQLLIAVGILYFKLLLITAFTLLLSTVATSSLFTIFCSFMIYLIGHLQSTAKEWIASAENISFLVKGAIAIASVLVPDMTIFEGVDQILVSGSGSWNLLVQPMVYTAINLAWILGLATWLMESQELRS